MRNETEACLVNLVEETLNRLDYRLSIKDEFIAASLLDPGQVHSALLLTYLNGTPIDFLKTLSTKHNLDTLTVVSTQISSDSACASSAVSQQSVSFISLKINSIKGNFFLLILVFSCK